MTVTTNYMSNYQIYSKRYNISAQKICITKYVIKAIVIAKVQSQKQIHP